jgi:hypothetical protein
MSQGIGTVISYGTNSGQLQAKEFNGVKNKQNTNDFLTVEITASTNSEETENSLY